jgi:hypothetical protein
VSYSFKEDVFSIHINDRYKQSVTTQRQMMGLTSCIFDPLGFFCPFVLKGKLLFYKATNLGLKWDDPLPEDIRVAFDEWREEGFGCAVYVCTVAPDGTVPCVVDLCKGTISSKWHAETGIERPAKPPWKHTKTGIGGGTMWGREQ